MKIDNVLEKIESYLNEEISWKEFGNYFENLMLKHKNFHNIFDDKIVRILEEIHSNIEYSDYNNFKEKYLINEQEFKIRLKNNYQKLKKLNSTKK